MTSKLVIKIRQIFHLVHASCKKGDESPNLNITLGNNIGRHNPSSTLKTQDLDIKVLGET